MSLNSVLEPVELSKNEQTTPQLAFLYEHPQWFNAIFAELERRGTPFQKLYSPGSFYSVEPEAEAPFKVLFNRMISDIESITAKLLMIGTFGGGPICRKDSEVIVPK